MQAIIHEKREKVAELCRTHHVRRLSVFGSAVRDDFVPERSDVDLLVEFESLPYPLSVENYWKLEEALIALFARRVDLIQEERIRNPYLLGAVRADQMTLYAA